MTESDADHNQDSQKTAFSTPDGSEEKQSVHRYNRREMLILRECTFSRTRPIFLSKDYDNDDGLFSPDKWLQHKWICEGVENRDMKRNKQTAAVQPIMNPTVSKIFNSVLESTSNSSELDQQTVLSPQRRGFSSGCRASSPQQHEQHGKQQHSKSRWRQGGQFNNGMEDFKPAFQKSALEAHSRTSRSGSSNQNASSSSIGNGGNSWTVVGSSKHHLGSEKGSGFRRGIATDRDRGRLRSSNTDNEPVPEWLDEGPNSVMDIIELKGFEDEQPQSERKRRKSKSNSQSSTNAAKQVEADKDRSSNKSRQKRQSAGDISQHRQNNASSRSRPSSRQTPKNEIVDKRPGSKKNSNVASPVQFLQASDIESALIREQQEKQKVKEEANKQFDIYSALGMASPQQKKADANAGSITNNNEGEDQFAKGKGTLPNSDAEFAAYILGLTPERLPKLNPTGATASSGPASAMPQTSQQQSQTPSGSRLSRFFSKNASSFDQNKSVESRTSPILTQTTDPLEAKPNFQVNPIQANFEASLRKFPQLPNATSPLQTPRPSSAGLPHQHLTSPLMSVRQSPLQSLFPQLGNGAIVGSDSFMSSDFRQQPSASISPPDIAQRNALMRKMQQEQMLRAGGGMSAASFVSSVPPNTAAMAPHPSIQAMQQQLFEQHRKRTPPMAMVAPFVPRPSSTEQPHQLLHSPIAPPFPRQSPLLQGGPFPHPPSPVPPNQFQQILMQTVRKLQPNLAPGAQPDIVILRQAFSYLMQDPVFREMAIRNGVPSNLPGAVSANPFQPQQPPPHFPYGPGGQPFSHAPPMPPFPPPHHFPPQHPMHLQHFGASGPPTFPQHHQPPQQQQMHFPPPLVAGSKPQNMFNNSPTPTHSMLNSQSFMPTSVMRQMSKVPAAGMGGGSAGGIGEGAANPAVPFLQKLFAASANGEGRPILGRGPEQIPNVQNCLKLEDVERDLAVRQQQNSSAAL